jgi:hypothetical protein
MPSASIDVLGSFKLNQWYKLAIYLGAVLIILSFVFVNNSNVSKYTSFGVYSLVLGLLVWILDDSVYTAGKVKDDDLFSDIDKKENIKNSLFAIYGIRWVGLLIWIAIILSYL